MKPQDKELTTATSSVKTLNEILPVNGKRGNIVDRISAARDSKVCGGRRKMRGMILEQGPGLRRLVMGALLLVRDCTI
jgi:hypothetical protein